MTPPIQALAERQLEAYNRADLDAFCACYHPQVKMYEGDELSSVGIEEFRSRYADKFGRGGFGAEVPARLHEGEHCVDHERWWVDDPETGARREGWLLVRYTLVEGRIGVVQFFY